MHDRNEKEADQEVKYSVMLRLLMRVKEITDQRKEFTQRGNTNMSN